MTRILYLVHDLDDPATERRASMLQTGGADVDLVGFRRGTSPLARKAKVLGRTYNGKFLQRGWSALRVIGQARQLARDHQPDAILVRSFEMLPLARRIQAVSPRHRTPRIIYEVLDVHHLMLGRGVVSATLRSIERRLCRKVDRVLVSSMRFNAEYLRRYDQIGAPPLLVENKVWNAGAVNSPPRGAAAPRSDPDSITIGWFGILRCTASLRCLDALCRHSDGRIKLILRGRPALDSIPDFHQTVQNNPHMAFYGAYSYPDDLPRIYGEVDIAWLIDRMDAGANSDWLLPNRLYESCAHGVVPLALAQTETGHYLQRAGIGLQLPALDVASVIDLLSRVDDRALAGLRAQVTAKRPSTWRVTQADCERLVDVLAGRQHAAPVIPLRKAELAG
ncbi:MAG: glycosyl transferase [Rhodobacterales bacterium]|nr:glycosyl transferase [Rhodobacterales bacterium]MDX5412268.1 glycosyl transferase [Rhodobacterales bacterium]